MAASIREVTGTSVLLVGDDPVVTGALAKLLSADRTISVLGATDSSGCAAAGRIRPDVILMDEGKAMRGRDVRKQLNTASPSSAIFELGTLGNMTLRELILAIRSANAKASQPSSVPEENGASSARLALAPLSERELDVVRLVAEGLSNKEISARLSLSDKTVKNHISHILAKMSLSARTQVAVCAIRAGLV